jgi:hypothetical protein
MTSPAPTPRCFSDINYYARNVVLENEVTLETTKTSNIIIGVQSIRSITSINTIISWKFWNENAPYE